MFYERLFDGLNRHGIRYLVVGGVAANLHGFPRLTLDVDVAVDAQTDQSEEWDRVCTDLQLRPRQPVTWSQMYSVAERQRLRDEKNLIEFGLLSEVPEDPVIDFLFDLEAPFAELWERRVIADLGGIAAPLIAIADLVVMKEKAGRPKDFTDIAHIQGRSAPDAERYS